jgi:hypothetical protein
MKIGTLRAIAHNIADSLGSDIGLLIGVYEMNVFGEAKKSPGGVISVDFLAAKATQGKVSPALAAAIGKYRKALPGLCAKHGASIEGFKTLTARYSTGTFNKQIVVTVRNRVGRCYVDEYVGGACKTRQGYRSTRARSDKTRRGPESQGCGAAVQLILGLAQVAR